MKAILDTFLYNDATIYIALRMAVILTATFAATKLLQVVGKRFFSANILQMRFLYNLFTVAIYFVGLILTLNQLPGFNNGALTLLTGSGIVAVVLGLAAQDLLGNAINSMSLSMAKPFRVGDRITVVGRNITGYIEDITLRHTVIRTFINSRMILPNSVISKEIIENYNFIENKASGFIDVTISHDSDIEKASAIIAKAIKGHKAYFGEDDPTVFVRALTVWGVELRASMWTNDIGTNFAACSDVRREIKKEFDKQGIEFARSNIAAVQ